MLNISQNSITHRVNRDEHSSFRKVYSRSGGRWFLRMVLVFFAILGIVLFLPWTQNIRSGGVVTTLKPGQRPQAINSVIGGRIEEWYVKEGDEVEKGDTILFISEVKDQYFDPLLLDRAERQLRAKGLSAESYNEKVQALEDQIAALEQTRELKLEQAQNKLTQAQLKVKSDSIDLEAANTNYEIAVRQYERMEQLEEKGLRSLTDLETRRMAMQKAQAEKISAENKLLSSQNEVLNAKVELTSLDAQYKDDIAKAKSEKFTALSNFYDAELGVAKLESEYTNYSVRRGMYYITAPQSGYITQTIQSGIGEMVKEGEQIVTIMPSDYQLAVEMYVRPLDLPLLEKGQTVRIQFDGWPAIVFSGWPNTSYGTYAGDVYAIDKFISDNGMYRILVAPDPEEHPWPDALRVGSGTNNIVLLKDVPIWYELWRQVNGFPPDYYKTGLGSDGQNANDQKKK
ncbi:HlyD family secretion protein [Halocola ammonii]